MILTLVIATAIGLGSTDWVQAQDGETEKAASTVTTNEDGSKSQTILIKEFIQDSGEIGYAILGLLGVGILFLGNELRLHLMEKLQGAKIYRLKANEVEPSNVTEIIERARPSRLAEGFDDAVQLFKRSGRVSFINTQADLFCNSEDTRHVNFQNRISYISDAAGGLGLLGTVLGIFRAFNEKGSGMDEKQLLAAMGMALGTTFLGILVSLILNIMGGEMSAAVNRRIICSREKFELLRDTLMIASAPAAGGGTGTEKSRQVES